MAAKTGRIRSISTHGSGTGAVRMSRRRNRVPGIRGDPQPARRWTTCKTGEISLVYAGASGTGDVAKRSWRRRGAMAFGIDGLELQQDIPNDFPANRLRGGYCYHAIPALPVGVRPGSEAARRLIRERRTGLQLPACSPSSADDGRACGKTNIIAEPEYLASAHMEASACQVPLAGRSTRSAAPQTRIEGTHGKAKQPQVHRDGSKKDDVNKFLKAPRVSIAAREKEIGQHIGYRYYVNPCRYNGDALLKKYLEIMGWDDLNCWRVHMATRGAGRRLRPQHNAGVTSDIKLPDNQQDRDMIARELLIKFRCRRSPMWI